MCIDKHRPCCRTCLALPPGTMCAGGWRQRSYRWSSHPFSAHASAPSRCCVIQPAELVRYGRGEVKPLRPSAGSRLQTARKQPICAEWEPVAQVLGHQTQNCTVSAPSSSAVVLEAAASRSCSHKVTDTHHVDFRGTK